ncbi:DNA-binding transcriptional LysR family regulator [Chelatococcus caeni]|uniref:DNA-binding transcriptional LysR family regulator n=1 Tax=Chelatococcus caeni TaxID=1348468 RepID=A0A840BYQ9_9HYPH|nr:LysR family transcriptional regulator [Chelatococcus caeni]MBB4015397.1 DNA-binding transcriptional LysR family regulator [Chelatococcus caeni]
MQGTALRYFLEVVRTGSVSEASSRLNVAASAVSRQIAKLERDLGSRLFERRPRGMVLSEAGRLLATYARRMTLEGERVVGRIRELEGLARGEVRIATTEGFALDMMPEAIVAFRRRYEGIRFDLAVVPFTAVTRLVQNGDVDIGVTFGLAPSPDVKVQRAWPAPILAVMTPDHPLAARESLTLQDLRDHPITLSEANTTLRQLVDMACADEGVALEPVLITNFVSAQRRFVETKGGMLVASPLSMVSGLVSGRLVARPVRSELLHRRRFEIQTMLDRTLPTAAEAFVAFLSEHIDNDLAALSQVLGFLVYLAHTEAEAEI